MQLNIISVPATYHMGQVRQANYYKLLTLRIDVNLAAVVKVVLSLLSKQHMMGVPSAFYSPVTVEKH